MSPLMSLFLIALGPMLVGLGDVFDEEETEEEFLPEPEIETGIVSDDEAESTDAQAEPNDTQSAVDPDDDAEADPVETDTEDTLASVEDRHEAARDLAGSGEPSNSARGTDADETMEGVAGVPNWFDASGGEDTVIGGDLNDTLSGGNGIDDVQGGAGDDVLFGAFQNEARSDDFASDTLAGGVGDDILFLGDGDEATGGEGQDLFVAIQAEPDQEDETQVVIQDFNPAEDLLALEAADPNSVTLTDQVVTEAGLDVVFSNGTIVSLIGIEEEIDPNQISIVEVDETGSHLTT